MGKKDETLPGKSWDDIRREIWAEKVKYALGMLDAQNKDVLGFLKVHHPTLMDKTKKAEADALKLSDSLRS